VVAAVGTEAGMPTLEEEVAGHLDETNSQAHAEMESAGDPVQNQRSSQEGHKMVALALVALEWREEGDHSPSPLVGAEDIVRIQKRQKGPTGRSQMTQSEDYNGFHLVVE
jgi:hypothetical protein